MANKPVKPDYTHLDAAILAAIKARGPVRFFLLSHIKAVQSAAVALESANRGHGPGRRDDKPAWRFVDGRLQALRKAGKIKHQRKPEGWVLVECVSEGAAA